MHPGHAARDQLERVILPFWLERGIDQQHGGFFTCFDNRGRKLLSTNKFTWSQGRFVWLLARAARLADQGLLDLDPAQLCAIARRGAEFLAHHAIRDDGTCWYLLDQSGAPVPDADTRSLYADCFAAMGLYELTRVTGETRWLELADTITARATTDIDTAPTPPYPIPQGYSAFGPRMILLNVNLDRARARQAIGAPLDTDLAIARDAMLTHFRPDGSYAEMRPHDDAHNDTLLAKHRTPGHALEGLWMALEATELIGDSIDVLGSVDVLMRAGWDDEHGGLHRYVDRDAPTQPLGHNTGTDYEQLVLRTWSTKLWWVHSEACYTTLLAAHRYGDQAARDWFDRVFAYTLATFPAAQGEGYEWIQIRDRAGEPLDEVVALPVKDPYHIARNLMQIVEVTQ